MSQGAQFLELLINQLLPTINVHELYGPIISSLSPSEQIWHVGLGALVSEILNAFSQQGNRSLDLASILSLAQSFLPPNVIAIIQALFAAALNNRAFDFQVALSLLAPYLQNLTSLVPSWLLPIVLEVINNPSAILNYLPLLISFLPAEVQQLALQVISFAGKRGLDLSSLVALAAPYIQSFISQIPPQILQVVTAVLSGKRGLDLTSVLSLAAPHLQSIIAQVPQEIINFVTIFLNGKRGLDLSSLFALAAPYIQPLLSQIPPQFVQIFTSLLSGKRGIDLNTIVAELLNLFNSSPLIGHYIQLLPQSVQNLINIAVSLVIPSLLG